MGNKLKFKALKTSMKIKDPKTLRDQTRKPICQVQQACQSYNSIMKPLSNLECFVQKRRKHLTKNLSETVYMRLSISCS